MRAKSYYSLFLFLIFILTGATTLISQPPNDDCSSPTTLIESTGDSCTNSINGTTFLATQSTETTLCSAFSNDDDVWYSFTPLQSTEYFFEVSNTTTETYVNIYSGTCAAGLTSIGTYCFNSENSAFLTAGTDYLVQVYTLSHTVRTDFDLCAYPNPFPNDECLGAIPLTVNPDLSCSTVTAGTTVGATASPEQDDVTGYPDNDVWFTFVATATEHQVSLLNIIAVYGTSTDMGMGLYEGSCGALVLVDDSDPETAAFSGLTIGNTYILRVYGWYPSMYDYDYAENTFDICVGTFPPIPANDECSSPTILLESTDEICNNIISGYTHSATQSSETTLCSAFSNDDDVWYSFTPSQTNTYFFELSNTAIETYVNIYSGSCATGLNSIGTYCFNTINSAFLTAGTDYLVQVYTLSQSTRTDFDLCAYPTNTFANDECIGAISLPVNVDFSCSNITSGSTLGATASAQFDNVTGYPDNDVWFSFTATETEHLVILNNIVALVGNSLDMGMGLYFGSCGSLTLVSSTSSEIATFTGLTIGTTYSLRIYGWWPMNSINYAENTFDICVRTIPATPSNDDCTTPITLLESTNDSCNNKISGTTLAATQSGETTLCSAFSNDDDVWYSFTPYQSSEYFFEVSNTWTETYVNIYSGTCASGLNSIGTYCFNSNNSANLTAGNSYLIQVYSLSHSVKTDFDLCAYSNTSPNCPDDFAGGSLSGSQPSLYGSLNINADYETDGSIISSQNIGVLNSNINVQYDSGTDITLVPGFEIALGVTFSAFIDGCEGAAVLGDDDDSYISIDQETTGSSTTRISSPKDSN